MNVFEIYSQMFYALNDVWHDNNDEDLGDFLNYATPFETDYIESADSSSYFNFKMAYKDYGNDKDFGYDFVKEYLRKTNRPYLVNAFDKLSRKDWVEYFKEYLEEEHVGSDLPEHSQDNMLKKEEEMNSLEMFTLMYFFADFIVGYPHETRINNFLSECNPFLFADFGSADRAVYNDFKEAYDRCEDKGRFGFNVIKEFSDNTEEYFKKDIPPISAQIKEEDWVYWAIDYLSFPHKGMEYSEEEIRELT